MRVRGAFCTEFGVNDFGATSRLRLSCNVASSQRSCQPVMILAFLHEAFQCFILRI